MNKFYLTVIITLSLGIIGGFSIGFRSGFSDGNLTGKKSVECPECEECPDPIPNDIRLWQLTNTARTEASLDSLSLSPCLSLKAYDRAKSIENNEFPFAHCSDGECPMDELIPQCFPIWAHIAENLVDYPTVEEMHEGLMGSPSHREAILGDYTHIGIGCYDTTCVQLFAK